LGHLVLCDEDNTINIAHHHKEYQEKAMEGRANRVGVVVALVDCLDMVTLVAMVETR
jgi:hypothetical protein